MCWIDGRKKVVKVASDERPIDFQYPTVENISCEEQCVEKPKSNHPLLVCSHFDCLDELPEV